ncbi:MAG: FecCD family ABC transporter permease [Bacillota bacterium]
MGTSKSTSYVKKIAILSIVFFFIFILALTNGAADVGIKDALLGVFGSNIEGDALIIREVRLPRVLAAIIIGAGLGIAGAMIQGLTRNPLADPGLLGITAGASLMLTVGYIMSASISFFVLTGLSFVGAIIGIVLVIGLSLFSKEQLSTFTLLLVGASVSMFLFALSQGLSLLFDVTKNVNMWTAGGLTAVTFKQLMVVAPLLLIACFVAFYYAKEITILSLDENLAIALGRNVKYIKIVLMIIIALLTGMAVALAGNLAFVGLMIPHIVRKVVGYDYKRIIPTSVLIGGMFMMAADLLARTINRPFEVPLIAVVSVIGLPFFLVIVRTHKGGEM